MDKSACTTSKGMKSKSNIKEENLRRLPIYKKCKEKQKIIANIFKPAVKKTFTGALPVPKSRRWKCKADQGEAIQFNTNNLIISEIFQIITSKPCEMFGFLTRYK